METNEGTQGNQGQEGGEGGEAAAPEWLEALGDDGLKGNDTLKRFKTPRDLASSYLEIRSKLGENPVVMPGDKDPPEKWEEFYKRIGRPESPDKYTLTKVEGLPDNSDMEKSYLDAAHKLGLTQKQADGLNQWVSGLAKAKQEEDTAAFNQRTEQAEAALKKEWGKEYEGNLSLANQVIAGFAGKELGAFIKEKGLDNSPEMVRFLVKVGKAMGEDRLKGMDGSYKKGAKNREQLEEMMRDPRYHDPTRRDPAWIKAVEDGFKALYPEERAAT